MTQKLIDRIKEINKKLDIIASRIREMQKIRHDLREEDKKQDRESKALFDEREQLVERIKYV